MSTARTDFDGFFLFERMLYGHYTVRVAKDAAVAARISTELGLQATVSAQKSVVRLGAVHVTPVPAIELIPSRVSRPKSSDLGSTIAT